MSSKSARTGSPVPPDGKPTAKRSPSILVTDSRSHQIKGARAPFAGRNFKKQQELQRQQQQQQQQQQLSGYSFEQLQHQNALQKRLAFRNKFTDISVDKLLRNSSDIPSGLSRAPPRLASRSGYGSNLRSSASPPPPPPPQSQSLHFSKQTRTLPPIASSSGYAGPESRRNIRSIPKLTQSLPARTSKTSQKLVLIPDRQQNGSSTPPQLHSPSSSSSSPSSTGGAGAHLPEMGPGHSASEPVDLLAQIMRSRAELMPKEMRAQEFSRMTAYFICEEIDLPSVAKFLRKNHEVKPRLYDEALYVPYALPLLPGNDGLRVKSNNTSKLQAKNKHMEKMIIKSEQTDHLYEYYSGVETPEDANNYSMDPEVENFESNAPFDPSEPQFFAPPVDDDDDEDRSNGRDDYGGNTKNNNNDSNDVDKNTNSSYISSSSSSKKNNNNNNKYKDNDVDNDTHKNKYQQNQRPNSPDKLRHKSARRAFEEASSSSASLNSQSDVSKHHAEMFVFGYGIIVLWIFSEIHEKNILADLAFSDENLLINPIDEEDIETEEFHFEYDSQIHRPRIYNDMITLRSGDHLIKLTMSYAIAQLTKLGLFESRMVSILHLISKLPKKLALTGRIGLKRNQLLKKSGKLFKLRVDVNLSSSILDTPEFFWSFEPALHPLYSAVRDYLEIDQRVQVLNDRCKVFLEFVDIVTDSMNEKNTNRITWMIIVIIFLSLFVSLFEFVLEIL
ncbi:conserved hypothetical protein [Lodderomyces elongisporus NRRL YB-4239]|uniref:DUF155 domain-containing protein n=1 Tax=Lodderomyces elongisporus (strain ATCC 11503 / CBS 2605 / JCM 1781 / NBRC 1676 / NRRL YB-4239) TaxID=379508 RepID=A5E7A6_LODEL|nr:conserved hypothetical protein [Lodderomyces elongisporus NRRL YB-4239]